MQRPALATLACINADGQHVGCPGQGNLAIRKVYGKGMFSRWCSVPATDLKKYIFLPSGTMSTLSPLGWLAVKLAKSISQVMIAVLHVHCKSFMGIHVRRDSL